jgi:hypothetical protein
MIRHGAHAKEAAGIRERPKPREREPRPAPQANPVWLHLATGVQAKVAIGSANDPAERQADEMADRVLRMPAPRVQPTCAACAAGSAAHPVSEKVRTLQRAPVDGAASAGEAADGFASTLGSGRPLEPHVRAFFEPRFGHDFGSVRVHTDARADRSARQVDALAFTVGGNVVFRDGVYAPQSTAGRRLLAHELTHVVQQGAAAAFGVAQPAADAHRLRVQRACPKAPTGIGATPPAERCIRGEAIAERGDVFLYCQDSTEFVSPYQEEQFAKLVARAPFASVIAVHGNASVEGPGREYNYNLACRRALDMVRRLRAAGIGVPIAFYSHGPTRAYGEAGQNRNVVVRAFYPRVAKSLSIVSWINPSGLLDFSKIGVALTPPSVRPVAALSMILKCTANSRPPDTLDASALATVIASKEYRAVQHYEFRMGDHGEVEVRSRQIVGYTAPSRCDCDDVPPCDYIQGEASPLNYADYKSPNLETLMKFRVGAAEEEAAIRNRPRVPVMFGGLSLSMLPRVPWVWTDGTIRLRPNGKLQWLIGASAFPTNTIYVDGRKVAELRQHHPIALLGPNVRTADQPRQTLEEEEAQRGRPVSLHTETVRPGDWKAGED